MYRNYLQEERLGFLFFSCLFLVPYQRAPSTHSCSLNLPSIQSFSGQTLIVYNEAQRSRTHHELLKLFFAPGDHLVYSLIIRHLIFFLYKNQVAERMRLALCFPTTYSVLILYPYLYVCFILTAVQYQLNFFHPSLGSIAGLTHSAHLPDVLILSHYLWAS